MRPRRRLLARAGAACGLAALLAGCFAAADAPIVKPEARADVAWLEGAFTTGGDAPRVLVRVAAAAEGEDAGRAAGVYRFTGSGGGWPELYLRLFRGMLGACPADLGDGLEALAAAVEEDPAEMRRALESLCSDRSIAEICAEGDFDFADADCATVLAQLRGAPRATRPARRVEESIEAIRWLAEGLPQRDDVLFVTQPLDALGAPGFVLAEVRAIGGRGYWSGFAVFRPALRIGDLLLLRAAPDGGGVEVWETSPCFESAPEAPIPAAGALERIAACAARLGAGEATTEGAAAPGRSQRFDRVAEDGQ